MASTAGFLPGPLMAVYYATKAYVVSFSEAIVTELEGTGVTVTALCPALSNLATPGNREAAIDHAPQPPFAAEPQGLVRCPVDEAGHSHHRPLEIYCPLRDPVKGGRSYPISRADPDHAPVIGRQHEPRSRPRWQLLPDEGTIRIPVNATRGTQPNGPGQGA